jgi:hypothetical protein
LPDDVQKGLKHVVIYEGMSVNRTQMGIKCKTHYILTWKKHLFLGISSTNIDALVTLLYWYTEAQSTEVF